MFEMAEHIILPIVIALLTGGLVAGIMAQRTAAKVQHINGLKETVVTMQDEMTHMAERMNTVRLELSANAVTITDLRAQISILQTRNFEMIDQVAQLRRENAALLSQSRIRSKAATT
jgi:predicted  nucleic acid-binding Zn-ribbon protein